MPYLEWSLDEDGGIEPETPLGRIAISGERGSLTEDNLMLDTFFEALIDGLSALATEETAIIDTIDEPHPLELRRSGTGVQLRFGAQTAEVRDRGALGRDLAAAVGDFLSKLDEVALALNRKPLAYEKLRAFWRDAAT